MSLQVRNQTSGALERVAGFNDTDSILSPSSQNPISNRAVYAALAQKIDKTVTDLINYYDKSQTYSKPEVRALIGAINTLTIEVVSALPTQDISTTTIYFVGPAAGANNYDEYVYVGGNWVQIGDTTIDLSNYVTSANLTTVLQDYYTKSQADALFNDYYDKDAVDDLLDTKQNTLTFDNQPIAGSQNPVTSAGIKTALDNILISGNGGSIIKVHHTAGAAAAGNTVTASKGSYSVSSTFDVSGDAIIIGFGEIGNVTITATNGSETGIKTINIPSFSSYTAEIGYGLDYKSWLIAGGVDPSYYTSLDEVFADEEIVRRLMTIHASVDYLATVETSTDGLISEVINNDICAKWINLRDYALDNLSANTYIKTIMDNTGKYGYGEWTLVNQVPRMKSNTLPKGEVTASGIYSSTYPAWQAFDQTQSTYWISNGKTNQWIAYNFGKDICINAVALGCITSDNIQPIKNFKVQCSSDGTIYQDIYTGLFPNNNGTYTFKFENNIAAQYWRIFILDEYRTDINIQIHTVEFLKWAPKGNVPLMTGNSAPFGEATASSIRSDNYQPYKAFSNDPNYMYCPTGPSTTHWFSYKFVNPVCVKRLYFYASPQVVHSGTMKLQGSQDGTNWTDLHSWSEFSTTPAGVTMEVDNNKFYLYYRIYGYMTNSGAGYKAQFYGRELTVSVPTMSNNTTPCGTAIASTVYAGGNYPEWKAFTGVPDSYGWNCNQSEYSTTNQAWVGYDFQKPVSIRGVYYVIRKDANVNSAEMRIIGRNNASDAWTVVSNVCTSAQGTGYIETTDPTPYRYYAIRGSFVIGSTRYFQLYQLNFYGMDYTERDWDINHPMKYLYDHGIELEQLDYTNYTISGWNLVPINKEESQLYFPASGSTTKGNIVGTFNTLEFNRYNVARVRLGNKNTIANSCFGFIMVGSIKQGNSNVSDVAVNITTLIKEAKVTSVTANRYINLNAGYDTRSMCITEWWLE